MTVVNRRQTMAKVKKTIYWIMVNNFLMKNKVRELFRLVCNIKRRIKYLNKFREAKLEILVKFWNNLLSEILYKSKEINDKKTKNLMAHILKIPKVI